MAIKQTLHESLFTLLLLFLNLLTSFSGVEGGKEESSRVSNSFVEKKMLFVFGDSYVDTGNFLHSSSYEPPSGITFPGKPAGRFCDGRVLSDYIASFMGIKSPIPYMLRDPGDKSKQANGMNFAYGGTGIFETVVDRPNMTTQIDLFEKLIDQSVYTKHDLVSSLALVNAASNDYIIFAVANGSKEDLPAFSASLVNQLSIDLRRIHDLGISKIAVALLEPLGCLPSETVASSYQKCIDEPNTISINHNQMLLQKVQELNNETGQPPVFLTLDLYNAFFSTLTAMQKRRVENASLMNPLEPCCEGVSVENTCGSVDKTGTKRYKICENPGTSFFWDEVHPSQNGWLQVYNALQSHLSKLYSLI